MDAEGFFDTLSGTVHRSSRYLSFNSRNELEDNKKSMILNNRKNTGYCFVTYSHSDEAKIALLSH